MNSTKILIVFASICISLQSTTVRAQLGLHIEGNQTVLFGNDTTEMGAKFLWSPSKSALRAGIASNDGWDHDSIGRYSFSFGQDNVSYGWGSGSWGNITRANGASATAWGDATLANGYGSTAWGFSTKAFKEGSTAWGSRSIADGFYATAWGDDCIANHNYATAWGQDGIASAVLATSWGLEDTASGYSATAWGGLNKASNFYATAWGTSNKAEGERSTAWGEENAASGERSSSWGFLNEADGTGSTVWGLQNKASNLYATVWGDDNVASGALSTAWGWNNIALSAMETVLGSFADTLDHANPDIWEDDDYLFVVGNGTFSNNRSNALSLYKSGDLSVGRKLTIESYDSPWGVEDDDCVLSADPSKTNSDLILVANDAVAINIDDDNNSNASFQILNGTNVTILNLDENGNLNISGTLFQGSDRNRKEKIQTVEPDQILERLDQLPVYEWQYKGEETRHLGPMAQDFHQVFGYGVDDKSISAVDVDGVLLAAIKAQQKEIEELKELLLAQQKLIMKIEARR